MANRRGLVAVLLVLLALGGGVAAYLVVSRAAGPINPSSTATPGAGSGATATAAPIVSPLTGRPAPANRPVLAVKIDNVAAARPQTGLGSADVVYVEPVEGGLSRIMAIFSAALPARIGPVRSARESDLELLRQFGRPGLAYSGANGSVLSLIAAAPVADLSQDRVPSAYTRSSSHRAPHNLYANPRVLLEHGQGISVAKSIGFQFGALAAGEGTATTRKVIRYGAATTGFTWSPTRRRWDVTLDGRAATTTDDGRLGAATVVIQYTQITSSALHDVLGNTTPYTHSVGSGKAVVLRDGVAIQARWARTSADSGTTFTTTTGQSLPFAAGPVWVVFAKSG
jgi:Protein of unknown function (DUF3048) N-terminal domain/Protein of unknown function (DUF3048) C-terminal domain